MIDDDERRQLDHVRAELEREFAGQLPAHAVAVRFQEIVDAFEGAPVRAFVPVLAHKRARDVMRRQPDAERTVERP